MWYIEHIPCNHKMKSPFPPQQGYEGKKGFFLIMKTYRFKSDGTVIIPYIGRGGESAYVLE